MCQVVMPGGRKLDSPIVEWGHCTGQLMPRAGPQVLLAWGEVAELAGQSHGQDTSPTWQGVV